MPSSQTQNRMAFWYQAIQPPCCQTGVIVRVKNIKNFHLLQEKQERCNQLAGLEGAGTLAVNIWAMLAEPTFYTHNKRKQELGQHEGLVARADKSTGARVSSRRKSPATDKCPSLKRTQSETKRGAIQERKDISPNWQTNWKKTLHSRSPGGSAFERI